MSTIRDEFEAWVRSGFDAPDDELLLQRNSSGSYSYVKTDAAWIAYQAATERAAKQEREDGKRLDHLQSRGATVEVLPAGLSWKFRIGGLHSAVSHNIRAAIDAAAIRAKGGEAK